jgi:hypothetical protein
MGNDESSDFIETQVNSNDQSDEGEILLSTEAVKQVLYLTIKLVCL